MTDTDFEELYRQYRLDYPPLINLREAAEIGSRKPQTLYDASSQGAFDAFKAKRKGIVLLNLRGYLRWLVDEDSH